MTKELENLLKEIRITYADCQEDGKTFEETRHIRRLDWKANIPVDTNDLETALKACCEGYNEFNPLNVSNAIKKTDPQAKVYVAREGSVCLYILTDNKPEMERAMSEVSADEIDLQSSGELRIWWD